MMNTWTIKISAICLGVMASVMAAAPGSAQGLTYDFVTTVKSDQAGERIAMRGKAAAMDDKARVEITEMGALGPNAAAMNGMYMIVLDNGNRFIWVNPQERKYIETTSADMMAGFGGVMGSVGAMMNMKATNVVMDVQRVGSGPSINGYATDHYRITQSWDMSMNIFGKTVTTREESTMNAYFAPSITVPQNPFLMGNSQAASLLGEEFAQKSAAMNAKLQGKGLPLRIEVASKTTDPEGKVVSTTATTEIQSLKQGSVPASMFTVPSGYAKAEAPKAAPGLADKAAGSAAETGKGIGDAAKDGAKEGVQETVDDTKKDVKNATKKAIRGLFGK